MNTQAMALPKRLRQFYRTIRTNLPHLTKPQAKTLALWSDAILHTGACGLTTVATYAALLLRQPQNTRRQRLREFYKDAWKRAVLPYLKSTQVWECPSNAYLWSADFLENFGGEGGDESNWAWTLKLPISYAYNGSFFHEGIPIRVLGERYQRARYLAEIPEPSWLTLLTETRVNYPDLGGWTLTQELTLRSGVVSGKGLLQSHRGGVNWVFCDGSAKWLKVAATCVPRQRWTPYERDQPLYDERARNLAAEYR
jgi:prepilin-type processing-associated H-X9-DG protein